MIKKFVSCLAVEREKCLNRWKMVKIVRSMFRPGGSESSSTPFFCFLAFCRSFLCNSTIRGKTTITDASQTRARPSRLTAEQNEADLGCPSHYDCFMTIQHKVNVWWSLIFIPVQQNSHEEKRKSENYSQPHLNDSTPVLSLLQREIVRFEPVFRVVTG